MAIGITFNGTTGADNPTLTNNDDTASGLGGNDTLRGLGGTDMLDGGEGDDRLEGGDGNDTLIGNSGNDVLDGGRGADQAQGGLGDDLYYVDDVNDLVIELANQGNDTVITTVRNQTFAGQSIELVRYNVRGTLAAETIMGGAGNDTLTAVAGDLGDRLEGGAGDDLYMLYSAGNTVVENAGSGRDSVYFGYSNQATDVTANVEVVGLMGGVQTSTVLTLRDNDTRHDIYGRNDAADVIYANGGDDKIHGHNGASVQDTLYGGAGNDTYSMDNVTDVLIELENEGEADQIEGYFRQAGGTGALNVQLQDNIERLYILNGGAQAHANRQINANGTPQADLIHGFNSANVIDGQGGNDSLYGGRGQDELIGGSGNDTLNAGWYYQVSNGVKTDIFFSNHPTALIEDDAAIDTLRGGTGDDNYLLHSNQDTVVELANEGNDTVVLHNVLQHTLADQVENIQVALAASSVNFTGNSLGNHIAGGAFNDTLAGLEGHDTLLGQDGNDELQGGQGDDSLWGGQGVDTLIGGAGNDVLNGSVIETSPQYDSVVGTATDTPLAHDRLEGGLGDDTYVIDSALDIVVELANEGNDTVRSNVNLDLSLLANIETGELVGDRNLNIKGSAQGDRLLGNRGDNELDGAGGSDTLIGGAGNDTYLVDSLDDVVVELDASASEDLSTGGVDTVLTQLDGLTLAANVENLTLSGTAVTGEGNLRDNTLTGNAAANVLRGHDGDDVLDGKAGADTLEGGTGNDTYFVDNTGDVVNEGADGGHDAVLSSVSFSLQDKANLEDLVLTGNNTTGHGNSGNNHLSAIGLSTSALHGLAGDDTLVGGGTSSNKLYGGVGNDTYFVTGDNQAIVELVGEGNDTVWLSRISRHTLADNVENAYVSADGSGFNQLTVIGNGLANQITGSFNSDSLDGGAGNDTLRGGLGNDTLVGGAGTDSLIGGLGDDTYILDSLDEVIVERFKEGTDSVITRVAGYTLGANLERLLFDLTGTVGNDLMSGGMFDDTLNGGTGLDTLVGGKGNDTYVVDSTADVITELSNEGTDTVRSEITYALSSNLEHLVLTGTTAINGTGTSTANSITGNSGNNRLDGQAGADTLSGGAGNDTYVVDNAGDQVIERANEGTDLVEASVSYTLRDHTEHLTLTGTQWTTGTGNALNNQIKGNAGANTLSGNAGNDLLQGFAGNDHLDGGAGIDTMEGGAGDDTFVIDHVNDVIRENADEGYDQVVSKVSLTLLDNFEALILEEGATNPPYTYGYGTSAIGNQLDNYLQGNTSRNFLDGRDGDDVLYGNGGEDTLSGGSGNDLLYADKGYNILDGGAGNDTYDLYLTNGMEADVMTNQWEGGTDTVSLWAFDHEYTYVGLGQLMVQRVTAGQWYDGDTRNYYSEGAGTTVAISLRNPQHADFTGTAYINLFNADGTQASGTAQILLNGEEISFDAIKDQLQTLATAGNDTLFGFDINERFEGGAGDDWIDGAGGQDTLLGGEGGDRIQGSGWVDGGAGNDYIQSTVNSVASTVLGGAGNDIIERAWGQYNTVGAFIDGGAGNDQVYLASQDTVRFRAGDGIDTVTYANNSNTFRLEGLKLSDLQFARQNSSYYGTSALVIGVNGQVEQNQLLIQGFYGSGYSGNQNLSAVQPRIEVLNDAGTAYFTLDAGTLQQLTNVGNDLNNTLSGDASGNVFVAGLGNDTVSGNAGDDVMFGGEGIDWLQGGADHDILVGDAGGDWLDGGAGNDSLDGGADGDYITDGSGNNTLLGGDGDDGLYAGSGVDLLKGGAGNDLLSGGAGNDTLMGGVGSDNYSWATITGSDQILIVEEGPASDVNTLWLEASVYSTLFRREGNDLVLSSMVSTGRLTVQDWFLGESQQLDTIGLGQTHSDSNGYTGGTVEAGDVDVLVQAMASFAPAAGATEVTDAGLRSLIDQTLSVYTEYYPN